MWVSLKSILGQSYQTKETAADQSDCEEIEKSFVFVDKEGNEIEKTKEPPERPKLTFESPLTPLPLLDISNASSPQSSPQLSPTKIEEGWFVAPPPCFTKNSTGLIEKSPLEDLLIEHPSMSVYAQVTSIPHGKKKTEDKAAAVVKLDADDTSGKRTNEMRAAACLSTPYSKNKGTKMQLDLKTLVEQAENTKPSQQAKWESDQYKYCPSYINRQNRVHRYQSRKHHNQKKKSISKPFAEKGKHGF